MISLLQRENILSRILTDNEIKFNIRRHEYKALCMI